MNENEYTYLLHVFVNMGLCMHEHMYAHVTV